MTESTQEGIEMAGKHKTAAEELQSRTHGEPESSIVRAKQKLRGTKGKVSEKVEQTADRAADSAKSAADKARNAVKNATDR
jgi:hypothetical protein